MKMIQLRSKKFISMLAALFMIAFGIMASGCGGGGGGDSYTPPPLEKPGAPTDFNITDSTGQGMVALTLSWNAPTTGGEPTSYEIYRSDTDVGVWQPENHYITLSAETFEFFESFMMEDNVASYWVVAAKNAAGETPSQVEAYTPMGGDEGFGNNFSAAMIFADNIGISGAPITGNWTKTIADIDYNTGLRPFNTEDLSAANGTLPYLNLDPNTITVIGDVTYYEQQTASTWQGEWIKAAGTGTQEVNATWGDNLLSQDQLTLNSTVRIEMVLKKAQPVDTNMTTYNMKSLYGSTRYEVYGTDGTEVNSTTPFVFAANARLKIQKMVNDVATDLDNPIDQPLFTGCGGPGCFGAEINVGGNLTYGFVWDLKQDATLTAGIYRITFSLDPTSPAPANMPDNTDIVACPNGTLVDENTCYIEINIGQ